MTPSEKMPEMSKPEPTPESSLEHNESEQLAENVNDVADAELNVLERGPALTDEYSKKRARRWGRMKMAVLGLMMLKALGGGAAPAEAGQGYSRTRAQVGSVIRSGEREVRGVLREKEMEDIRNLRDAEKAIQKLEAMYRDMARDYDRLNDKYTRIDGAMRNQLVELAGTPGGLEYAKLVESFLYATNELQSLERDFQQNPIIPSEDPDYQVRIQRYKDAVGRLNAVTDAMQSVRSESGWDTGREPRSVREYTDNLTAVQSIRAQMDSLRADMVKADALIAEKQQELEQSEQEYRSRSRNRKILGGIANIGGAILRDKVLNR